MPKQPAKSPPPARRKARTPPKRTPVPPARNEEVLEAALELIAEHGVTGASLRRLAKRLGMSQPSLYHYFPSKDALVAAILDYSTMRMVRSGEGIPPPRSVDDVARFMRDSVLALYATESHPRFVRFLFSVAIASKKHRPLVEKFFDERLRPGFAALAASVTKTSVEREYVTEAMRMVVYSLGFMLLEDRALLGHAHASAATQKYADWVLVAANQLLAARPR